ncbi:MAG: putative oxidoreductase, aryl-alcohol dehydrogenase like protein [Verrucomicrobiales bacterium]|nr:putative oxidoreductase, aryl-alcohol dehydrogenase like protein [Verrucomicrobiales bacterium]
MPNSNSYYRPIGKIGLLIPKVIFGTGCLGNLFEVVPVQTKRDIVSEIIRNTTGTAVFDSAGKYGAGLALEALGSSLHQLGIPPSQVIISNKLGWYRIPLKGPKPTFERDVWAGIHHDAELRISYDGILQCYQQGRELLGAGYTTDLVSVHDPDEYLAAAQTPAERARRFNDVLGAYRALFELKASGKVRAVGIGAKDWHSIQEICQHVDLDWVMLACSLTVYTHPPELLDFICWLNAQKIAIINAAVFNAGFLIGGKWFDYRQPEPSKEPALFAWREKFLSLCSRFAVKPADACVQFGLALPGVVSIALNTGKPERVSDNIASILRPIPTGFWLALKETGLISKDYPIGNS